MAPHPCHLYPFCSHCSFLSLSATATDALLADASRKRPRLNAGHDALQSSGGAGHGQGQGPGFIPTGPGFPAAALPLPFSAGGLLAPGTLQPLATPGLPVMLYALAPSLGGSALQFEVPSILRASGTGPHSAGGGPPGLGSFGSASSSASRGQLPLHAGGGLALAPSLPRVDPSPTGATEDELLQAVDECGSDGVVEPGEVQGSSRPSSVEPRASSPLPSRTNTSAGVPNALAELHAFIRTLSTRHPIPSSSRARDHTLVVVSADVVECSACLEVRGVSQAIPGAVTREGEVARVPGHMVRSSTRPGGFFNMIEDHVKGTAHVNCLYDFNPSTVKQGRLDMFLKPIVRDEFSLRTKEACRGYRASSVMLNVDGKPISVDPFILIHDLHPGIDASGNTVWYADHRRGGFFSE